jgi:hypothetical protein
MPMTKAASSVASIADLMLSTALLASPHCIVPGLVRGRLEEAAQGKSGLLNVGHGDMQVRTEVIRTIMQMKSLEEAKAVLTRDESDSSNSFRESTFEGSQTRRWR